MKLLIVQFSPTSCHFISLWSKYSSQHPVLKHPPRSPTNVLNSYSQKDVNNLRVSSLFHLSGISPCRHVIHLRANVYALLSCSLHVFNLLSAAVDYFVY
jgi:hypothetical protein